MFPRSSDAAKTAITQREMEEFLDLKDRLSALKRRFAHERQRLRQRVEGNAPVEPGWYEINVKQFVQQRVTKAFVVAVLGEEDYEWMRSEAPPTVYYRLVVKKRARKSTSFVGKEVQAHAWTVFVRKDRP